MNKLSNCRKHYFW